MKPIAVLVAVLCSIVWLPKGALAQYGSTINPKDYESPSGRYRMHVEPTDRRGEKHCIVTMFSDGNKAWEQSINPTLWLAGVTDEGEAFGIGYIHSFPDPERPRMRGEVTLMQIIKIDADGHTKVIDEQECRYSASIFACGINLPRHPFATNLALQPESDTLLVSADLGHDSDNLRVWWRYKLSDGAKVGTVDPVEALRMERRALHELEVAPIPNTPLVLTQWQMTTWGGPETEYRTLLGVCSVDGVMHWQDEHSPPDNVDSDTNYNPREASRPDVKFSPGGFTVTTPDQQTTTTYLCAPDRSPGAWSVVAISRAVNEAPEPVNAESHEPEPATVLGTITLDSFERKPTPFWTIFDFDIDQNDTIGFLRRVGSDKVHLTFTSMEGNILGDRPLTELGEARARDIAAMSDGRWLICCSGAEAGEPSVFYYDPRDDTIKPPYRWEGGVVMSEPVALPNGGFLGLVGFHETNWYGMNNLVAFDRLGRELWRAKCSTPEDIIVDQSGRILVLENIRDEIRYFSADGEELETLDLETATGAEVRYPTNLAPLPDGGVLCFDYPSDEPFIRLDRNGELVERFRPQHEDGWSFTHYYTIRTTDDGSFWITDGSSLIRTDDQGKWTRVLGDAPWEAPLRQIGAMALGPGDTPHVVNARNHAAHIFDAEGRERAVLLPDPAMFSTRVGYFGSITVGGDGTIRFGKGVNFETFDHAGARLTSPTEGSVFGNKGKWRYIPGSNERWQIQNRSIRRLDESGEVAVEIDRTHNSDWIGSINKIAIARDGSVAISSSQNETHGFGDNQTSVYRKDGTPVGAVTHGFEREYYAGIAYAPPYVIFSHEDRIRFVHESGQAPPRELVLPFDDQPDHIHYRQLLIPEREGEVWVWCSCSPEITRVAFPE